MRIENSVMRRAMAEDPERWLYPLNELEDPLLATGIACCCSDPLDPVRDAALIFDYSEGTVVRLFSDRDELFEEAAAHPAVGKGTRFCFCGGLPLRLRESREAEAGGHLLRRDDGRRTLERYGLFGFQSEPRRASPPPGRTVEETDLAFLCSPELDGLLPEGTDPGELGRGDRIWRAAGRWSGLFAGYLWAAQIGRGCLEIVNLPVRPGARGMGVGKALVSRFAEDSLRTGFRPYYGYAVSSASAALARSMGFRPIHGETVSFYAEN